MCVGGEAVGVGGRLWVWGAGCGCGGQTVGRGEAVGGGSKLWVCGGRGVSGKSLHPPLNFAVNLKVL